MVALFFIGRILFGGYFLYNAYNHFRHSNSLAAYAKMKGVPMPKAAVIGSGVLLLIGGITFIIGWKMIIGMWALIVFLVPITIVMHAFWKIEDPQMRMNEEIQFGKNVALIGSLLVMIALSYLLL